jgi:hypothetical protein
MGSSWNEAKKETRAYFSISSVHSFSYFVRDSSFLEKLLWIGTALSMLFVASMLVENAIQDWRNNPIASTVISGSDVPLSEIQFPTVTICPDYTPNRWGFLRNLLNLLKFQCNSDTECEETEAVRAFLSDDEGMFPLKLVRSWMPAYIPSNLNGFYEREAYAMYYFPHILVPYIERHIAENGPLTDSNVLQQFLQKKFEGRINNYGIYKYLELDVNIPYFEHVNISEKRGAPQDDYSWFVVLAIHRILAMPSIGNLGTILSTYELDKQSLLGIRISHFPFATNTKM